MFEAINYILHEKNLEDLDNDIMASFVPYMVARYFSFYDSKYVNYVNDTINSYGRIFKTKEDTFRFFDNVIPKVKRKKIPYVKKAKEEKKADLGPIPEFFSRREMEMLTKGF